MIQSFRSKATESLFADEEVPRFRAFERIARRKLLLLHRAKSLEDLRIPPGNRLEALRGNRRGSTAFELTISGGFVLCGLRAMPVMLRLWTTIEVSYGAQTVARADTPGGNFA